MKNGLILLFLLYSSMICLAQDKKGIQIGSIDSIYSNVLKENRPLLIYTPEKYDKNKQYPVVYLLDGESFFHFYTGMLNQLSNAYAIPEMIVVGVVSTNRNKDFTPTADATSNAQPNGGGEQFTAFLKQELIPYIESHYATAPYNMLIGHSLGGLLVVNILLKHPSLFTSYVALDPSLWWDSMKLNHQSYKILAEHNFKTKNLFLAMANSMPLGMTDTTAVKLDTTNATVGMRSVLDFRNKLSNTPDSKLRWQFQYYPQESHGSVPLISSYDALKFLFDFYKRPSFQKITDSTAIILENHYIKVSEKMGYPILPPASDINGLAWRCKVLEKNNDRALVFLEMYVRLYPKSPHAFLEMARFYDETGDKIKAQEFYQKSKDLNSKVTKSKP